ncbi:type II toxin-antitoxin system RelE family toxin [Desulfonatronum thiodismutans]|uniref:type II toxin-antitoxin system RelE family toxin n=1 Tax=Desulfonatronum thiodismutans TaxID=159290 RepID=UPI0004ABE407|nr:hypothetical protein [Desulfonatronum thiodismutans]
MSLRIISLPSFKKDAKNLSKKYKNLTADLRRLHQVLTGDPRSGIALSKSLYKLRLANTSTTSGKSGGFRVIYYYIDHQGAIYLLKLYSKTDIPSISESRLVEILKENNLE